MFNRSHIVFFASVAASFFSLMLFCARLDNETINNPLLSSYKGDYKLSAEWLSQTDTFLVFHSYQLEYASTGRDTFVSYDITTDPDSAVDPVFSLSSMTDSTIDVYFIRPHSGIVTLVGTRPNEKTNETELSVVVVSPFTLQGDTAAGIGNPDTIQVAGLTDTSLSVQWYLDGSLLSMDTGAMLVLQSDTVVSHSVFAIISDSLGHSISSDTLAVSFQPHLPTVKFPLDSIQVPVGEETTISLQFSDCDSIRWVVKGLGILQTNTGSLKTTFTSPGKDTIIATGISRHGAVGTPDTLYVTALVFAYSLEAVTFPDTIQAGEWATWQVQVTEDGSPVVGSQVTYEWATAPDSVWDSTRTNSDGSRFQLYVGDSVASFVLSVRALISGTDSTAARHQNITVRVFRPSCVFVTQSLTTPMNQDFTVSVRARDSNDDGSIANIFYFTSDNSTPVSTNGDTSWTLRFLAPGIRYIKVWAVDNDGFSSDTDSVAITVVSDTPTVTDLLYPDTVFKSVSVQLAAVTAASSNGGDIQSYYWDFDEDTSSGWDTTTVDSTVDYTFTSAGSSPVWVKCSDEFGRYSPTAEFVIEVDPGAPRLSAITIDTAATQVFVGDQREYSITATDPNGIVAYLSFNIDGVHESTHTVNGASATHAFTHTFTLDDSGSRTVRIIAVDNDSLRDTVEQVVEVKLGKPRVTSIGLNVPLNSIYILDDLDFTIKGTDENDRIDSIMISWDGDETYEVRRKAEGDSIKYDNYQFARADSGVNTIRVMVKDIDGLTKDSTFEITVLSGAPQIDSISPSQNIWVNDLTNYTIHAHDNNGTVDSFVVDWDNDGTWDLFSNSGNVSWAFDTSQYGSRTVKVKVHDDDTVWTEKSMTVDVRLGKPRVWVDGDTLFVATPASGGDIDIAVNSYDTNGTFQKYYWDFAAPFDTSVNADKKTSSSTYENFTVTAPGVNTPFQMAVFGKDDDDLIAGDTFWLYPDGPPPAANQVFPLSTSPAFGASDDVEFEWTGIDKRDSLSTEYQVEIQLPGQGTRTIISPFKSGTDYTNEVDGSNVWHFKYTYSPASWTTGTYKWWVKSRDALGSPNESSEESFFHN